jgi:hypothetical protein
MYMMARIEAGAGELKVQSQVCHKLSDRQNSIFLTGPDESIPGLT